MSASPRSGRTGRGVAPDARRSRAAPDLPGLADRLGELLRWIDVAIDQDLANEDLAATRRVDRDRPGELCLAVEGDLAVDEEDDRVADLANVKYVLFARLEQRWLADAADAVEKEVILGLHLPVAERVEGTDLESKVQVAA